MRLGVIGHIEHLTVGRIAVVRAAGVLSAADLDEWDDAVWEYRENNPGN